MRTDTDPNSTISEFLTKFDDYQLFQLMKFYRDRLEQAMEGRVDGVSLVLTYKRHFSGQEHRKVTELTEKGNRADSSKLLLTLVMEKGSRGPKGDVGILRGNAPWGNKVGQNTERNTGACGICGNPYIYIGTDPDCAVLSHVIGLCDTIKHLDLQNCNIQGEGLQRLGPVLHKYRVLRLGSNKLGETGVKLLSAALRNPDCKLQELGLDDNDLTASSAEDLASALGPNRSLTVLNLNNNKLGDSGVKLLCAALRNPDCKIRKLRLRDVGLTNSCAENLVSAISITCSLRELNLCNNKLGDSGVKILCAVLRNPDCKIQKLWFLCEGSLLQSRYKLITDGSGLGTNKLGDSGVKILSVALRNPDCQIECLRLYDNGLSASGVKDLTSTLSTNRSLTELDQGHNKLRDSGAKLLAAALGDQKCKIQSLQLDDARLRLLYRGSRLRSQYKPVTEGSEPGVKLLHRPICPHSPLPHTGVQEPEADRAVEESVQFKRRETAEVAAGYKTQTDCGSVNISIDDHHCSHLWADFLPL